MPALANMAHGRDTLATQWPCISPIFFVSKAAKFLVKISKFADENRNCIHLRSTALYFFEMRESFAYFYIGIVQRVVFYVCIGAPIPFILLG